MSEACPVCGSTEWYVDYVMISDGDEMRVDRCKHCDWPPNAPMSVEEWRAHPSNPLNKKGPV